jgi:ATP/maltotriose-dependent transcriptional regulator MalT
MKKTLLIYGFFLAFTSILLKTTEYWFWIKLNTFDIYAALLALIFLGVGLWLGTRLNQQYKVKSLANNQIIEHNYAQNAVYTEGEPKTIDEQLWTNLGISKREYEVLTLLGTGMSNQEIADSLFISQNTVKTHTSRLFEKLAVKNRTHAILKSKELGIISA